MDSTDSRPVQASSDADSRAPSRRQVSSLQAIGCGALGLLIGYGLAVVATHASIPAGPGMDTASAGRLIAPVNADLSGVPSSVPSSLPSSLPSPGRLAAPAAAASSSSPGLEAVDAWTAPLPGGLEPCWAERPMASC
jgi:hypothetical protein